MQGVLPYQDLIDLVDKERLQVDKSYVKPASVDVPISDEIYHVQSVFIPPKEPVLKFLRKNRILFKESSLDQPLKKNHVYLIKASLRVRLPKDVWVICSPKSSIGRVDVHVRLMGEGTERFDFLPEAYEGEIWLVVIPKSFDVRLKPGLSLIQMRLVKKKLVRLRDAESIKKMARSLKIIEGVRSFTVDPWDGGIVTTVDLSGKVDAWTPKDNAPLLDLTVSDYTLDPDEYFTKINTDNRRLFLEKGRFYLLRTKERVHIPEFLTGEFLPIDINTGEFRTHYAGFVDPGWGKNYARALTLEVRPFEDIVVVDRQPIAKLYLDRLTHSAQQNYDKGQKDAHYKEEFAGPVLSKFFQRKFL